MPHYKVGTYDNRPVKRKMITDRDIKALHTHVRKLRAAKAKAEKNDG